MPKSAAEDLFGLDALSSPGPAPAQAPQSTGGSGSFAVNRTVDNDPFGSRGPMTPTSPTANSPQHQTVFKPFAPSSSFGQSLNYQGTGGSNSSGAAPPRSFQPQHSAAEDLLGDNDREDFRKYTRQNVSFSRGCMFMCRSKKIMNDYYSSLFPWLERCEKIFGFNLKGYNIRLYAFLAERYHSYWFNKYTEPLIWPVIFYDITKTIEKN